MTATVAVLLGLLVAVNYGTADFLGGLSARRLSPAVVVQSSQTVGLALLLTGVLVFPDQHFVGTDVLRGAIAGSVGLTGIGLLYRGLAQGAMSIVAPITAVGAAVLPLLWGVANGERPSAPAMVGVVLALAAVALVSSPSGGRAPVAHQGREVALALLSGAAFGVVFILLADSSPASGLWPVAAARIASVTLGTLFLVARRQRPGIPAGSRAVVAGAGALDAAANVCFLLAARHGLLSLVAVVSSLYPAATVVLARVVLDERVDRRQQLGLGCALAGVVLIAV
jgi:drug/metabolite transporter (DMT)-like permease